MPSRNEARVLVTPPFAKEGLLGIFAARPLNPSLGGAPYTLFSFGTTLHGSDAVITHSEFFQPTPHQSPLQQDSGFHRGIDSFFEQRAHVAEEVQNAGLREGFLSRPPQNPNQEGEGTISDRSSKGTLPSSKKRKNRCLNPYGGILSLICGVSVSMAEAQEMEGMALVGKNRGRNPS